MLRASRATTAPQCIAAGGKRRGTSPTAHPAGSATRRASNLRSLLKLQEQTESRLRVEGGSSTATFDRPPSLSSLPLTEVLGEAAGGDDSETYRAKLERRWQQQYAEPEPGSSQSPAQKVFIRRRSSAAAAASAVTQQRESAQRPSRASGSPGPSGRELPKSASKSRPRAASQPQQAVSGPQKKSRRIRSSLPVLAPRISRDGAEENVKQEVLERGQETEYIAAAQEAFRLELLGEKIREQLGREATQEELAEAAGMSLNSLVVRLTKGREARDAMVQHNLRLVASVARKYAGNNVPFHDLMQEGSVGLLKGLAKFDIQRGYKFSTYCHWWIRQAITRALSDQSRTVRIPIHVYDSLARIRKTMKSLEVSLGRDPSHAEIAEEMNNATDKGIRFTAEKVEKILSLGRDVASADALVSSNDGRGKSSTLLDMMVSTDVQDESLLDAGFLTKDINALIHTLEPTERAVLRMHYGLQGDDPAAPREAGLTFIEIGRRMGMSKDRVRAAANAALQKLREPSRCRSLISYV